MFESETKKSEADRFGLFLWSLPNKNNVVQGINDQNNYRIEYRFWMKPYACVIQRPFYTQQKISLSASYTEVNHNVAFLTLRDTLHEICRSFFCSADILFRRILHASLGNEGWLFSSRSCLRSQPEISDHSKPHRLARRDQWFHRGQSHPGYRLQKFGFIR